MLATSFQFAEENQAGLAGAGEVSAAAGLAVEAVDFNGAEDAFAFDFFADAGFS